MLGQERRRNLRNSALMLDILHIVTGILIVVLCVLSFLDPEGNMLLLPLIFLLAAALNLVNGVHRIHMSGRGKRKKISGFLLAILGILLLALSVVSAVSIWWG